VRRDAIVVDARTDATVETPARDDDRPPPRRRPSRVMTPRPRTRHHGAGYSRFVVTMKLLLPTVALVLIGLVAVWPYLQTTDTRFRIGFSSLKAREAEDPAMVNARYVGTDESAKPFSITADLAKNLLTGTSEVELEMPKADVTLDDNSWLVVTAETGIYNRKSATLNLVGEVNLFHDSGYEIRTAKALVSLEKGIAVGTSPVSGHGPFGNLTSQGFRLEDKGKLIVFTGKAKLILYPEAGNLAQ
jgi:lipopolysaccharide export system protein LptC